MRMQYLLGGLIGLMLLPGCATSPALDFVDPMFVIAPQAKDGQRWDETLAKKLNHNYQRVVRLRWRYDPQSYPAPRAPESSFGQIFTDPNPPLPADGADEKRQIRDELVYALLDWIDEYQENYKIHIHTARAFENIASDFAVLGLNAAGAVVGGESIKSILAAASAAVTGASLSIDENFFFEKTTSAIVNQMDALRSAKKTDILHRLNEPQGIAKYPLPAAEHDLLEYFYAGSLVNALTAIADDAAEKKIENAAKLRETEVLAYATGPLIDRIRRWVRVDRATRLPQLADWLGRQTPAITMPASVWMNTETDVRMLQAAIDEFGIPEAG